jgi:Ca-activated chloride channel family protein
MRMFRRLIPLAIAALVSTGSLAASAAGRSPSTADGPCPKPPVDTLDPEASDPATTLADSDELESRCDIVPEAYYLSYTSPEYEDMAVPAPASTSTGGVAVAEAGDGIVEPMPPTYPEPGPLDDNTFVDEGDSTWVDTESDRESTFALDVDTGSFSVAQQFLAEGYRPEPDSIRPEEWINSFDYGDEPADRDDVLDITVDATSDGPDGTALVRLGITTSDLDPIERPSANITFVIDTSGSMDIRERLGMVKASLALLVRNLRPDDTIAIVTYGDMATPVLAPTPVEEWRDIVEAIDELSPGGSTNMEAGLLLGYEQARESYDPDDINVVVLASDGVANQGVTDPEVLTEQITQSGEHGIHLVTVGYGMGNYNDYLMEQLADQGDGFYSYVDTFAEAERLFVDELTPTLYVVAEQAKVQVVFDPAVVSRYRLIGYENRMLDDEQFTDDSVDAGELGAGHQVSALYEVELVGSDGDVTDSGDGGDADVGTVRLRWNDPETGDVDEIEQDIEIDDDDEASDSLRMAALVAYTAEVLKGNSVVTERDVELDDLLEEAEELADEGVDGAADMVEFLEAAIDAVPPAITAIED